MRLLTQVFELILSIAAFAAVEAVFPGELPSTDWNAAIIRGLAFWAGAWLRSFEAGRSAWVQAIERTAMGTGLNLLVGAALVYTELLEPTPLKQILIGGVLSGALVSVVEAWRLRQPAGSVLLVGRSSLGERVAADLGAAVIGVVGPGSKPLPPGLASLGDIGSIADVVARNNVRRILVAGPRGEQDAPDQVPDLAMVEGWTKAGILVEDLPTAYETLYLRVCSEGLTPSEILRSPALAASPAMMSLQATYSNLVGLALLITLSPLIVVLAILSRMAAGPGPFLDHVECAGFQGIPFQRLYFRIRSARTGKQTAVGAAIGALRLTGLPQLINLVRGEMAMFGPVPARKVFSDYLEKTIPPYSHRLSMRPGILGWTRAHLSPREGVREEVLQLEYDLYYIKQCSPTLDFEILLRTILRVPHLPRRSPSA